MRKTQIIKKNSFRLSECYKKCTLFLSRASTHQSFNFNLWFLYELKQNSSHKFVFLFNKKYGLFYFKEASTKSCESIKKGKFVMKIFFQIILNKVLNPQCWHFCKWIKWWFVYIQSINGLSNEKWALIQTQANKPNKLFLVEKVRRFLIVHYVLMTTLCWKPISKNIVNW